MARWLLHVVFAFSLALAPLAGFGADDPLKPETPDDYELHKLLVDAINQVERNYVQPVDRRKLVEAAIQGVLRELDDYSSYVAPEKMSSFRTAVSHQFGGIGIQVGMEGGRPTVISPLVGSPAYRAGMIAGDRILEVDGTSTKGLRLDEVVKLMKGPTGTSVTLKVSHPGREETEELTLTREVIRLETVLGNRRDEDDQWEYFLDEDPRIGYVRITGFGRSTAEDLQDVLQALEKQDLSALVLDLRFNPGGLLSSAIQVADLFVSEGKIVSTEGRNVKKQVWNATERGTFEGFPVAVLVNRFSASASEIVAACLQDHDRAVVVGERTYGKGSVQRVIEMEGGQSALKLTTAGYHRPNGKNIDRHPGDTAEDQWGVTPNDGFALKLSDVETVALARHRRNRDILKSPAEAEPSEATEQSAAGEPESGQNDPDNVAEAAEFVDRQLEMALEFLRKEFTKRVAEGSKGEKSAEAEQLAEGPKPDSEEEGADGSQAGPSEPAASPVAR